MNFLELLFLFFSAQAVFMAMLFLVRPKGDKWANVFFAIILLLFSYDLFYSVLYWSKFDERLLAALRNTYVLPLSLYGAMFFLYFRRVSTTKKAFTLPDLLHFTPFLLLVWLRADFYFLSVDKKMEIFENGEWMAYIFPTNWAYPVVVLILLCYGVYAFLQFKKQVKDEEMSLWTRIVTRFFLLFTITHLFFAAVTVSGIEFTTYGFDYSITLFIVLLVASVSYFSFIRPTIFDGVPIDRVVPFVKYQKTGLPARFSLEMKDKLQAIMMNDKPFLDAEMRLDKLAMLMDIPRNHASQIINEHFEKNFFDFMNLHRNEEAKALLIAETADYSVTEVAYKCGFNNRVSFYKAFRKFEGTTPTEYKKTRLCRSFPNE